MKRLMGGVSVLLCTLTLMASPAHAASLRLLSVDAREADRVAVRVQFDGDAAVSAADVKLLENGKPVSIANLTSERPDATILVLDVSADMQRGDRLDSLKSAAQAFINGGGLGEVSVVKFSDDVVTAEQFTSDPAALNDAINRLRPEGTGRVTIDALARAGALLDDRKSARRPTVITLSGGADTGSGSDREQVTADLRAAGVQMYSVALADVSSQAPAELFDLTSEVGGATFTAPSAAAVPGALSEVNQTLDQNYVITYASSVPVGDPLNLSVTAAGATADGVANQGVYTLGDALSPASESGTPFASFFENDFALPGLIVLVLLAVGLLVMAVIQAFSQSSSLNAALRYYEQNARGSSADDDDASAYIESELLRRAMAKTEQIAEQRGYLDKIADKLEQADVTIRPGEFIFFSAAGILFSTAIMAALKGPIAGVAVFIVGLVLPVAVVNFLGARRRKKFERQLPDMLQLLAGSLKAGFSFAQGLDAVVDQIEDPMRKEFRRALTEAQLGRPIEDALEEVALRTRSNDFEWTVMAIRIQREVGGNLAELLETVGDTIVERTRLKREVAALTAEGRISAIILGILPVGLGVFFYFANHEYMSPLFTDNFGRVILGTGIGLAVAGFIWMRSMLKVEI